MEIYTPSQARTKFFKLFEEANDFHEPIYIVGKKGKVVLLSEEEYRSLTETLYISSIPGLKESIIEASKEPIENFSEEINWD